MSFEIHELQNDPSIIHIQMDQESLSWDFPQGSPYDLCAVFDCRKGKSLRELQLAGVCPFLFHKRLKTACRFQAQAYPEGFLLFPARIRNGVLDIGNQTHGQNALCLSKYKDIHVRTVCFVKRFFRESLKTTAAFTFSEADIAGAAGQAKFLYYLISGSKTEVSARHAYKLPITSDTVQILTGPGESVLFFKDPACTEVLTSR